ncbi:hypothetical protein H6P81_003919 [Aristolochia fimbriata]|uniref:Uncharacterized protein n=1 Tax=Aristolochia fimbriata TaxID=158543 RepID=A0AAV7FF05_ARIFI|nr:hypothetical protein H6P81_003919 [Aristolochia fimbriata]
MKYYRKKVEYIPRRAWWWTLVVVVPNFPVPTHGHTHPPTSTFGYLLLHSLTPPPSHPPLPPPSPPSLPTPSLPPSLPPPSLPPPPPSLPPSLPPPLPPSLLYYAWSVVHLVRRPVAGIFQFLPPKTPNINIKN